MSGNNGNDGSKGYLRTENLRVGYQKHIVVENIEIVLQKGEILTLSME